MENVTAYLRKLQIAEADKERQVPKVGEKKVGKEERKEVFTREKKVPVPKLEVFNDLDEVDAEQWMYTWQMHVIAKRLNTLEAMTLACTFLCGTPLRWMTKQGFEDTKIEL